MTDYAAVLTADPYPGAEWTLDGDDILRFDLARRLPEADEEDP
jgi:hypothetical protein